MIKTIFSCILHSTHAKKVILSRKKCFFAMRCWKLIYDFISTKIRKFFIIFAYIFSLQQQQVPTFAYEKRLSRIETLRLAITYIGFMTEILAGTPPNEPNRPNELTAYPPSTSHPHHHHHLPIQRDFIPPYNHQWI